MAHPEGHVSLLVHFRPIEVRAAAERLALFLSAVDHVQMSLDAGRGNLELSNVRDVDLRILTDWLYARGARCVFVRYQHEGRRVSIAYGADDGRDPLTQQQDPAAARPRRLLN